MNHEACHMMHEGEILNANKAAYPLFQAVLYGGKVSTEKFSKRLSCAIKHLPLRVQFTFEYDSLKAAQKGIAKDPTLTLDGEIFFEGLMQAEMITEVFEEVLVKKKQGTKENGGSCA